VRESEDVTAVLVIRKEQLEAFRRSLADDLLRRVASDLRRACPLETASLTGDALQTLIEAGRERAREFEIVAEEDLRRYLEFTLRHGTGFEVQPETAWAVEILRRRDLEPHERLNALDEYQLFAGRRRP
jgi:hypothetical protein